VDVEDIGADLPAALTDLQRRAHANYSRYRADVADNPARGLGVTLPRTPSNAVAAAEMIAMNAKMKRGSADLPQDGRLLSKSVSAWTRGRKRPGDSEQLLLLVQVWARWAGRREDPERWKSLFDRSPTGWPSWSQIRSVPSTSSPDTITSRAPSRPATAIADEHRGEAWIRMWAAYSETARWGLCAAALSAVIGLPALAPEGVRRAATLVLVLLVS
jgi:hypothetical protein